MSIQPVLDRTSLSGSIRELRHYVSWLCLSSFRAKINQRMTPSSGLSATFSPFQGREGTRSTLQTIVRKSRYRNHVTEFRRHQVAMSNEFIFADCFEHHRTATLPHVLKSMCRYPVGF